MTDVLVIGAGAAGLSAARRLHEAGLSVVVVDKGRGVGGRLATRRVGEARLDHGAQFFTARSRPFQARVDRWLEAGVAREWCRGFGQPPGPGPDGHARYVGASGMTALAKDLASGIDVRISTTVRAVAPDAAGWRLRVDQGPSGEAGAVLAGRSVLATAPVPQTLALLAAGGVTLPAAAAVALEAIRYEPTLAALVCLEGPSTVPAPGGVQLDDGLLRWVGDNAAKGVSPLPAVTLHASGPESAARWDDPPEVTLAAMRAAGARWLGPAPVRQAQLVRWRFAQPTVSHPERCLVAVDGPGPLVCAGDAFGEARVEGATLSGWAAADALVDRLDQAGRITPAAWPPG